MRATHSVGIRASNKTSCSSSTSMRSYAAAYAESTGAAPEGAALSVEHPQLGHAPACTTGAAPGARGQVKESSVGQPLGTCSPVVSLYVSNVQAFGFISCRTGTDVTRRTSPSNRRRSPIATPHVGAARLTTRLSFLLHRLPACLFRAFRNS